MVRLKKKTHHPLDKLKILVEKEKHGSSATQFCFAYYKDIEMAYSFWCSRYENISFKDFMNIGLNEFNIKIANIPEGEPLYKVMQARGINTGTIKDKDERKYWEKMKRENKIPDVYLPEKKTDLDIINKIKKIGVIK